MGNQWKNHQLEALSNSAPNGGDRTAWEAWAAKVRVVIRSMCPEHLLQLEEIIAIPEPSVSAKIVGWGTSYDEQVQAEEARHAAYYTEEIERRRASAIASLKSIDDADAAPDGSALQRLLTVLDRFPVVARQLRQRHDDRDTLRIEDEYDVQDLLHALLLVEFDDVRPEDPAPSQGGTSSRVDFLLFNEKIVVEVKKTRDKLRNKELTTQINDDAGRYQKHPDCKTLVCFVYDSDHLVNNPKGFETDHTRQEGALALHTVVRPQ
jgi:hypothetical protein